MTAPPRNERPPGLGEAENALLRSIVDATTDSVCVKDAEGRLLFANKDVPDVDRPPHRGRLGPPVRGLAS